MNIKGIAAKVAGTTKSATGSVTDKIQMVRDAHTVKANLTEEQKAQMAMFKAVQGNMLHAQADAIREAKRAAKAAKAGEEFVDTYTQFVQEHISTPEDVTVG